MSTESQNIIYAVDTAAKYRTAISTLDAMITNRGWVRTTDTGQINFATVGAPVTTELGYSMYKMNDSLQATVPLFMRIGWGGGTFGASFGMWAQFGMATNGAGVITGTQASANFRWLGGNAGGADNTNACLTLCSGDVNRLCFATALNGTTVPGSVSACLSIERSKDINGADNSDGFIIWVCGTTVAATRYGLWLPASGGTPNSESAWPVALTNSAASAFGSEGPHFGIPIPLAGSFKNPGLNVLVHLSTDFTRDTQHTLTMYDGAGHPYYICGPNINGMAASCGATPSSTSRLAIRWE